MEDNESVSPETPTERRMEVRYLKSSAFRVIHTDGAWGGVTPRGDIHMVLYSERPSIPDNSFYEVSADGHVGKEIPGTGTTLATRGMVREVEVDAIMTLPTAKVLLEWLSNKVNYIEKAIEKAVAESEASEKNSEGVEKQ